MRDRRDIRDRLKEGPLVGDAAMGTALYERGIFINKCYDELCITQPDMVVDIHSAHVAAGAEVLETNSFGANRFRLAAHGLESIPAHPAARVPDAVNALIRDYNVCEIVVGLPVNMDGTSGSAARAARELAGRLEALLPPSP